MLRGLIQRLQSIILVRPGAVLAISLLAVGGALWLASGVELRTSRSELAPANDPDQQRLDRLVAEFRGSQSLIVCVEAEATKLRSPADLRAFADALASELAQDPLVAQVFHRVDPEWLMRHGLYLMPVDVLETVVAEIDRERALLDALSETAGWAGLNRLLARRIEAGFDEPGTLPDERAADGLRQLARLLRIERDFLEDPTAFVARLSGASPLQLLAEGVGQQRDEYLQTDDGEILFLVVSPVDPGDSLPGLRALIRALRARVETVRERLPGFHVAFTGPPAMTVEEMDSVRRDTWSSALIALAGVSLLTLLVFRWKAHALLVLAALAAGLAGAFGAVRLELGYLNVLTSSFVSTLIGVGVAYGIHPVSEYELEGAHTRDPLDAVRAAYHRTGAAVTVAAVTTAAAFLSILLMQFRGFAELGLVAGVGVLLCLLASLVFLPALLLLYGRRRARRDPAAREKRGFAAVDRLWVERTAGRICRFPRATTLVALALTGAAAWGATGIGFNSDILDLLPRGSESLQYLRRMTVGSDLSPVFNLAVAEDLDSLRAMRDRALAEPHIARFDSVLRVLPEEPRRSERAVTALAGLLADIELPAPAEDPDRGALVDSLGRLQDLLEAATEQAFAAGLVDLVGPLEQARGSAEEARGAAAEAPADAEQRWGEGERAMLGWLGSLLEQLRRAASARPPSLETLPPELRERFVTERGKFIGFIYPRGSVFDPDVLDPYIESSRRVAADVTGYPLMFHLMSHRITSGFYRAVGAGALLVVLILLVDYRNLRDAALALFPLAVGVLWMMGGMRLLGLDFNFANLVAVPLIIGVGIDNGVHVMHRVRLEGSEGMNVVLRHTGRAILISSLTTMIGFGSLALASHVGLASLGKVLLLGVGSCLLTSTMVLPNLLVVLGLVRR